MPGFVRESVYEAVQIHKCTSVAPRTGPSDTYRPGCVLVMGVMLAECAISCARELRELALEWQFDEGASQELVEAD